MINAVSLATPAIVPFPAAAMRRVLRILSNRTPWMIRSALVSHVRLEGLHRCNHFSRVCRDISSTEASPFADALRREERDTQKPFLRTNIGFFGEIRLDISRWMSRLSVPSPRLMYIIPLNSRTFIQVRRHQHWKVHVCQHPHAATNLYRGFHSRNDL